MSAFNIIDLTQSDDEVSPRRPLPPAIDLTHSSPDEDTAGQHGPAGAGARAPSAVPRPAPAPLAFDLASDEEVAQATMDILIKQEKTDPQLKHITPNEIYALLDFRFWYEPGTIKAHQKKLVQTTVSRFFRMLDEEAQPLATPAKRRPGGGGI